MPAFVYWPLRNSPLLNMPPESNAFENGYDNYDLQQWDCPYCFKTISSSRPPIFNPNNCSCVEAGTFSNGDNEEAQPSVFQQQVLQIEPTGFYQRPRSWASSSVSATCPEGPEREIPNINIGNTYLPLGPDKGLNEAQHRRSVSFHSDLSYQMRQFLIDGEPHLPVVTSEKASPKFLPQDIHIQSQRIQKVKNRSKPSYQSSSTEASCYTGSLGGDPTLAVGAQFDQNEYGIFEQGYPLDMSMSVSSEE